MRYVFLIVVVVVSFVACGESDMTNGEGNNVVRGVWNSYYEDTDSLVMTRVFTSDYYSYFTFANGKFQDELNKQQYSISTDQIVLDQYTQGYLLKGDTLWITNSMGDQVTKYIRWKD